MFRVSIKSLAAIAGFFIITAGCSGNNPAGSDIPEAPSNLTGEATGVYSAQLYWTDNSNNEDGFILYRSVGGPYEVAVELEPDITAYHDQINASCVEVSYYIVARNSAGNSSSSNLIDIPLLCGPETRDTLSAPFAR